MSESDWEGFRRRDGLSIAQGALSWVILPPKAEAARGPLAYCPCCNLPLDSARAAKLVADKWLPIPLEQ